MGSGGTQFGRSRRRSFSSVLTSWSRISSGSYWFFCSRRFSSSPSIRSSSLTVTVATLERQSCFVASSKHPRSMIVFLPVCLLCTLCDSKKRDTIISRGRTHISRLSVSCSSKARILLTWVGSEPSLSVLQPGVGLQS
jgi:hypothetical protein